jgi:hypothetical protein
MGMDSGFNDDSAATVARIEDWRNPGQKTAVDVVE